MVTKANDLIQKSRFKLSHQQQKIVLYLISQISPFDEDFRMIEFSISEFCKVCGLETSGKNYNDLKANIKEIADQSVWVDINGDGKETLLRWIEKPYIDNKSGTVRIRMDEDMKPFLLQLKNNFTRYELLWTLNFKSKYTTRLYELIKSIHFHELETYERTYTLVELRRMLGLDLDDKGVYPTYQTFKTRVLNVAVQEINNYSDKNVTYVPIKNGRSVEKIKFIITTKDALHTAKLRSDIEHRFGLDEEQTTLWDELEAKGVVSSERFDKKNVIEVEPVEETDTAK